ncbi:hypothetical protein LTR56_018155 [Elasticomyces elasticus]|nr:hypothetical protein LTR22_023123 [Elasticomyces elasticus]KAK3629268.1 hypothetical protein LTR56_018155 [Elasticomyces elasticus]KAK4912819.1 hypothetical protein LTR49_018781 [Elasticomyces elasticus]KAK5747327.1 hypothetical protein LTS12_022441 [Elasticomyces elasticus]
MAETSDQSSCRLFGLPAELRLYIYELAFTSASSSIKLLDAAPPSKALILTCRQAYNEAAALHRAACLSFWPNSQFETVLDTEARLVDGRTGACVTRSARPEWEKIRHLTIRFERFSSRWSLHQIPGHKIWERRFDGVPRNGFSCLVPNTVVNGKPRYVEYDTLHEAKIRLSGHGGYTIAEHILRFVGAL